MVKSGREFGCCTAEIKRRIVVEGSSKTFHALACCVSLVKLFLTLSSDVRSCCGVVTGKTEDLVPDQVEKLVK